MAWIDVVVVNRDALMKTANFAQCLSEKRPLPDVKLKNQGENENFRRALRDLAFYRLGEGMSMVRWSRWQHSEPSTRGKFEKTSCKSCQTRGLFLSLRPITCSRLDFACQYEDGSSHASFDQLSWGGPPLRPFSTIGSGASIIH